MILRYKTSLLVCWRLSPAWRSLCKQQPKLLSAKISQGKASPSLVQSATHDDWIAMSAGGDIEKGLRKSKMSLIERLLPFSFLKDPMDKSAPNVIAAENSHWKRIFFYLEEISYMSEVRNAQKRVMQIKTDLREAGNKKREILAELEMLRNSLHHIYKNMKYTDNRSSDQYLLLVKEEVELYTREKGLQEAFTEADKREQFLFNDFSAAISDSYEKEKLHTNFVKVLGVIGTILGSFITLVATIVGILYNQSRFYTLRQDVETTLMEKMDEVSRNLGKITTTQQQQQQKPGESWGSYLNRHTRWIYSWAKPKN